MADITFTVTATNTAGASASAATLVTAQATQLVPVTFGETAVLAGDDFGNANILLAQKTTQPYPGILSQLAFWTGQVAGQLRLGINADGAGGNPGALEAQSPALAPVANDWTVHNFVNGPFLQAGPKWLAYTPSSNSLHFRSGAGGTLRHVSRSFQAMPATFPANPSTVWDGSHFSFYATILVDPALLPPPPEPGFISYFNPTDGNWTDPSIIGGEEWHSQNGNRPWSLTKLDDFTLRMELRQGDPQSEVGGERSEISGFGFPDGTPATLDWDWMLEPGATLESPKASWVVVMQGHDNQAIPCSLWMDGDHLVASINDHVPGSWPGWRDPNPVERGRWYHHRWEVLAGNSGYARFYRDGVKVFDYAGLIGSSMPEQYFKLGIYRGDAGFVPQTMAVRVKNIVGTRMA